MARVHLIGIVMVDIFVGVEPREGEDEVGEESDKIKEQDKGIEPGGG